MRRGGFQKKQIMTDRGSHIAGTAALLAVVAALCLWLGFQGGRNAVSDNITVRVDTLTIRDTIVYYRPPVTNKKPAGTYRARLALAQRDTAAQRDTVYVRDTVEVEVPVMSSRYRGDNYDIGVRGFRTELEYVKVFPETRVVTRTVARERRWGFGVAAGPSALVSPSGRVTAGLGVTGGFYLRL